MPATNSPKNMMLLGTSKHYHALAMSRSSGLSSQVDVQVIVTETEEQDVDKVEYQKSAYVAVGLIITMTAFCVFFPVVITSSVLGMKTNVFEKPPPTNCSDPCRLVLVESLPEFLTYPEDWHRHPSTYDTWSNLIEMANHTVDIVSHSWKLRAKNSLKDSSNWQGEALYKEIYNLGKEIKVRIALNIPNRGKHKKDIKDLSLLRNVEVRSLNLSRWFGSGKLNVNLWIVDEKHFYMGSANVDWWSMTQLKQLGLAGYDCACLVTDLTKVFEMYWYMAQAEAVLPEDWPHQYHTAVNHVTPLPGMFSDVFTKIYLASSPPQLCPSGRTSNIDAILDVINTSHKFVYIAMLDYLPAVINAEPKRYWPVIDTAIRQVALNSHVEVRLLASWANTTNPDRLKYYRSLSNLNGVLESRITVKLFYVPSDSKTARKIASSPVNHNMYILTEQALYIGTFPWSGDNFLTSAGIGIVLNQTSDITEVISSSEEEATRLSIPQQLKYLFLRDWNSSYALDFHDISTT